MENEEITRICSACGIEKEINEFTKKSTAKNGRETKCKVCCKERISSRHIESIRYSTPKFCKCCELMKTEADFSIHTRSKSGYKSRCKECIKNKTEPVGKEILTGSKVCKVCKIEKDFSDFTNMSCKKDGKNPKCKKCVKDRVFEEIIVVLDGHKICSKCKIEKPFDDYGKNKDKPLSRCKKCLREDYYASQNKDAPDLEERPIVEDGFKYCTYCKKVKETSSFGKVKRSKDRLSYWCKSCACEEAKRRNPPKNIPPLTREERLYRRKMLRKEKYLNDPLFKLETSLRSRINDAYRYSTWRKGGKTEELLGTTFENAMYYIEKQFIKDMSWENQGSCKEQDCNKAWHLDHIIPYSWAKNEEDMYLISHNSNLQPMWDTENMSKSAKVYPCTNLELMVTFWEDRWEYVEKNNSE